MSEAILNIDTHSFDKVVGQDKPVVVDFWAPWCGPCKAIAPILEQIAQEMGDAVSIAKVNVDDNQELAAKYAVRAIPTMLFFKSGEVKEQIVGLTQKQAIEQTIAKL